MALIRQNYNEECEAAVNKTINRQYTSYYFYLSVAFHFDRDDVALKGFHKYFKALSDAKRQHAMMFMKYQNERGGRIVLQDITRPSLDEWGQGLDAMKTCLAAERDSNQAYIDLHSLAEKHGDEQLADFVEENFLEKQTKLLKEIGGHIQNLTRVGPGLGEYQFDQNLK